MNEWTKVSKSPSWKPEKDGDSIEGLYVNVDEGARPDGKTYMIYTIESSKDHENVVLFGSAYLDPLMKNVPLGKEIKIVFKGFGKKQPGKNAPKLFEVFQRDLGDTVKDAVESVFPEATK